MADNDNIGLLTLGSTETGQFGNNFGGFVDDDGRVTATFTGTTSELTLSFDGFDVDSDTEVEVLVNGTSLGFLTAGVDNDVVLYTITIPAALQIGGIGTNVITFRQAENIAFDWGV